jgi:hypothetical protein
MKDRDIHQMAIMEEDVLLHTALRVHTWTDLEEEMA